MSSHTSLAQDLSLVICHLHSHPWAHLLDSPLPFYFYLFFPVFSFYLLHSELYPELDNPIVMESLCYSANKGSLLLWIQRCSVWTVLHHFYSSMFHWTKDLCPRKLGDRSQRIAASSLLLKSSILHLVCDGGSHTPFPRLWGRETTSLLHEIGVRTLLHAMNFRGRCFCCLFIVQSMSLCIDMKMMRSFKSCGRISSSSPRQLLDFLEKLRRCVRWENSPLEHDCLSVNVVQLAILQGLKRNTQFFPVSMLFGDRGSSGNSPPRHSTGSEKTCTSAFNCSIL